MWSDSRFLFSTIPKQLCVRKIFCTNSHFYKRLLDLQPGRAETASNVFSSSKISRDVAQLGSVLAWGARGRRFKSCHPDTDYQTLTN